MNALSPLWSKVEHLSACCLAPVEVSRYGSRRSRCSRCRRVETVGAPESICCCSIRRGPLRSLRCVRLPSPVAGSSLGVVEVPDESKPAPNAEPKVERKPATTPVSKLADMDALAVQGEVDLARALIAGLLAA